MLTKNETRLPKGTCTPLDTIFVASYVYNIQKLMAILYGQYYSKIYDILWTGRASVVGEKCQNPINAQIFRLL